MGRILLALFLLVGFTVQAQPQLKGGLEAFVTANKVYPPYSLQNCIEGLVNIGFKLNKKGEVYYSVIRKGIGTDLDDEALRLIRLSSGKWEVPAGHDSTLVLIAPMVFNLSGYGCDLKTREDIQRAIANYKSSEGMTNAVLNFYKNKDSVKYKPEEEARILRLKAELGYDEAYLKERINDGQRKLKQKDQQGACEDFLFVKHMGSNLADELIAQYCR
ncbi:energy transducer TonB [Pedobacter sp. KBW06]|uniref:energy transducer TonB n=1 Tax=Pedobacter sp. KBW06 TaxID=2153359 RepID=UPI000F5942CD|nr:energy transducer TonB [Pedobacter sp. KBW06]RQO67760.1 energy transducer TonB [Pedobacter sp. KBW06]